ncbi:MAG TPA: TIM-barrel domain-containing protein [Paludibacter sp.]
MLRYLLYLSCFVLLLLTTSGRKCEQAKEGLLISNGSERVLISFYTPTIVRVQVYLEDDKKDFPSSLVVIRKRENIIKTTLKSNEKGWELISDSVTIAVDKKSGQIDFISPTGKRIITALDYKLFEQFVNGEALRSIQQSFAITKHEGLYGLGQNRNGTFNLKGHEVRLVQTNTSTAIPFVLSTNGYGILWDNASDTKMNNVVDLNKCEFTSEAAYQIDYYLIFSIKPDSIIGGYRFLTGNAPLYGKWAYGYWQSKEHYKSGEELISVAKEYRRRNIPIDNIVQDWKYWGDLGWNALRFDTTNYPHPQATIKELHSMNFHFMPVIWSVFGKSTQVYKSLKEQNMTFSPKHWSDGYYYDAFNPKARSIFWKYAKEGLFDMGVDAWWMDGTEPEIAQDNFTADSQKIGVFSAGKNFFGNWAYTLNAFPLVTTQAIYDGQRKETDQKRVFILARSAFAGQQRNAAALWSGDIDATWAELKKQISGGLNYCMSGLPYWTHDIGGFFTSQRGGEFAGGCKSNSYRELYVRWFQFGAFSPLFRSHGTDTPRELWQFGDKGDWAYEALLKADRLRYSLIPYIYSNAWKVTKNGYTLMRGLPMDFPEDEKVFNIGDEYMFGNALLIAPVTENMYYPEKDLKGEAIPASAFSDKNKTPGLNAFYFKGKNFENLLYEIKDSQINFEWKNNSPDKCPVDSFSIKWSGYIISTETGVHKLFATSDDGNRVWIDNKPIIDDWANHGTTMTMGEFYMEKGKKYPFKMDYFDNFGGANIELSWLKPSQLNTTNNEKKRNVYLPKDENWYYFWDNQFFKGGEKVVVDAPIDIIPMFVRAGSIIPFCQDLQFAMQKYKTPLEIRIYQGKNGSFELYEDEGDTYNYEKGLYTIIPFLWNENKRTLTIGDRVGSFPLMEKNRQLKIILISSSGKKIEKVTSYNGEILKVTF